MIKFLFTDLHINLLDVTNVFLFLCRCLKFTLCFCLSEEANEEIVKVTFGELRRDVALFAAAMRKMGVQTGDRVVGESRVQSLVATHWLIAHKLVHCDVLVCFHLTPVLYNLFTSSLTSLSVCSMYALGKVGWLFWLRLQPLSEWHHLFFQSSYLYREVLGFFQPPPLSLFV